MNKKEKNIFTVSIGTLLLIFIFLFTKQSIDIKETKKEFKKTEQVYKDSIDVILSDIDFFIDYIYELEFQKDSIKSLYVQELNKPKIFNVIDTVTITQDSVDIETEFNINFDLTEKLPGTIYNVKGITKFNWDFQNNIPINYQSSINEFEMRLNVATKLEPINFGLRLETQPLSPNIIITDNINNIISEQNYMQKVPTKLGIGFVGGVGYSNQGFTPYLGIGITYSFYDFKHIF